MIQKDIFAVSLVSIYFFMYALLLQFDATRLAGFIMALFSPVLLCWMVYSVLKHGKYTGRELDKDEFGYQDKVNEGHSKMR